MSEPGGLVVETPRLLLRAWRDDDAEPFAAMNADPEVTRYVGGPLARTESDAMLARLRERWAEQGYGRCAVESRADARLLGSVGLGPHPAAPGEVEIGWRLVRAAWGRGIATEAALAVRDLAFDDLALPRLVSVTQPANAASLAVMRRIGMRHWRDLEVEEYGGQPVTVWVMEPADRS